MKKLATIQTGHNTLNIEIESNASFVKIYSKAGKLIRHSRIKNKSQVVFYGKPNDYIVETNGKFKTLTSIQGNRSIHKASIKVQKASEDGIRSVKINGLTFNANKVKDLISQNVIDADSLKKSLVEYYESVEKESKNEILSEDLVREVALGNVSETEKTKIKTALGKVSKEKERIKKLVEETADLDKILTIKSKFPKVKRTFRP